MSIALVTITHDHIGEEIFDTACQILGEPSFRVRHVRFSPQDAPEDVEQSLVAAVEALDSGDGVLVLSDLYGSTPCNVARRLPPGHEVQILSGINLPMVLRVLNYAHLELAELAGRAADAGRLGVVQCAPHTRD